MFLPNIIEKVVQSVKPSALNKDIYVVTLVNHAGIRSEVPYSKKKMKELMEKLGISSMEELKGRKAVIKDKNKIAFLPEGAELTIAARDKDGKLIEFDFLD